MIGNIRNLIHSKVGGLVALLFIGLIAVAFALGDVTGSGAFGGLGSGNAAKVGDEKIGLGNLNDAVTNAHRAARQQNPLLTMEDFVKQGGLDGTLDRLINSFAIADFAEDYGLSVSQSMVDSELRKLPGTKGLDGRFDKEALRRMLADANVPEKLVRDDIRRTLLAEQLLALAGAGNRPAQSFALPYANMVLEQRAGEVAILPSAAFVPAKAATADELTAYYRRNSARFSLPEQRALHYVLFTDSIVGDQTPTEAEIKTYYDDNRDAYAASETRSLSQLIVPTEAGARALMSKLSSGEDFAQAAAATGLSVARIGPVTQDAFEKQSSAAVAKAAFTAPSGRYAGPVKGRLGWHIVRVDAVAARPAQSLADARAAIVPLLAQEKRDEAIFDITSTIEEELDRGSSLKDIAATYKLKIETTPLLIASGNALKDPDYRPIPEMQRLLPVAFDLDSDGTARLVEIEKGKRFGLVSVAEVRESAPPPLDQVRQIVMNEWALEKGSVKARAAAEVIRLKVEKGMPLGQAIAETGLRLPSPQTLKGTRAELVRGGQQVPPPLALMFAMREGSAKTLRAPQNRGWFVVKLDDIVEGDARGNPELLTATKLQFSQAFSREYSAQFIAAMRKHVGVERNEGAIADMKKRMSGTDSAN